MSKAGPKGGREWLGHKHREGEGVGVGRVPVVQPQLSQTPCLFPPPLERC